jgi:membrane protein
MPPILHQTKRILTQTWEAWNAHNTPRIGAALAYYTIFSMAPILIIAIAVAGMVFGEDTARQEMILQMRSLFGVTGAKAIEEMLANANQGGSGVIATIIGIITLLIGSSSIFGELQSALNLIWDAPPRGKQHLGTILRRRFLSFAMVLVIGFLLLVSLVVSALLSGLQNSFGGFISSPFIAQSINVLLSIIVTTSLFSLIYKVLPDVKIAWKDVGVGAFVTALLFAVGKQLIGLYLGNSTLASTYGAAGSFAVMLVWIYYSAQLILLGAEFTQVYAHRRGSKIGEPLALEAQTVALPANQQKVLLEPL